MAESPQPHLPAIGRHFDFFVKDYELKIKYLSDQFSRMWTRFNFFLTLESGLLGGKFIIGRGGLDTTITLVLLSISIVWYVFGAQDRYLVGVYRTQVEEAANKIKDEVSDDGLYDFVGKPVKGSEFRHVTEWYIQDISITRLAAWLPFCLVLIWGANLLIKILS
jgi:hypothetical protein